MRYVALGDSYTIGVSCEPFERFPELLVRAEPRLELVADLGVDGYTSADLIRDELPVMATLLPEFVTLLVGVNDVVQDIPLSTYQANVIDILDVLGAALPPDRIVTISIPDYTVMPRGADFGEPVSKRARIVEENRTMARLAGEREIAFVDIFDLSQRAAADRSLVADDGLHPSGTQYALWVERLAPVVTALLRNDASASPA
jgi:acyl-CoA thioesterase I